MNDIAYIFIIIFLAVMVATIPILLDIDTREATIPFETIRKPILIGGIIFCFVLVFYLLGIGRK